MKKNKVTVFDGQAKLAGKDKLAVEKDGKPVGDAEGAAHHPGHRRAGARPAGHRGRRQADLDLQGGDGADQRCRRSLLVIGSGAIGIEFASFYRNMGAEVTVVEVLDRVLPVEDEEISAFARKALREAGHEDPHRRRREGREEGRRQRHGDRRGRRQDRRRSRSIA